MPGQITKALFYAFWAVFSGGGGSNKNSAVSLIMALFSGCEVLAGLFGWKLKTVKTAFEFCAHNLDLGEGQVVVEWKGNSALADGIGNGEVAFLIAELLSHKGLQVCRREIVAHLNPSVAHGFYDFVSLGEGVFGGKSDDKNEPGHPAIGRLLRDN